MQSFAGNLRGNIQVNTDNSTVVPHINKYGGCHNKELNALSRSIWEFCLERNLLLRAIQTPGKLSSEADRLSCNFT